MPYPPEQLPQVGDTIRACKANEGDCTWLAHKNIGMNKDACLELYEVATVIQGPSPEDNSVQYLLYLRHKKTENIVNVLIDWRWCSLIDRNSIKGTIAEPEQPTQSFNRLSMLDDE